MVFRKNKISRLSAFVLLILLFACDCNKNRKKVDVSNLEVNIEISRLEMDIFSLKKENLEIEIKKLHEKYGDFFKFYIETIMGFGIVSDSTSAYISKIDAFTSNTFSRGLFDSVAVEYEDLRELETELELAFKHVKFYFPQTQNPQVITFISEFGNAVFTYDTSILAIGLDLFMGPEFPYYTDFFPDFMLAKLQRDAIPANCMKVIYDLYFSQAETTGQPLVHKMIENGKRLYFVEFMIPDAGDDLIIGYSADQIDWCEENEGLIWKFFSDHDLFYNTDFMEHRRYLGDRPNTPGMPPEAPGDIGSWVGWQIVRQFMKNAGDNVTFAKLFQESDTETILSLSKYKPK